MIFNLLAAGLVATASASIVPRVPSTAACQGNSALDRAAWCEYDIHTDFYNEIPNTGVTREYWLDLANITASPDGYARTVLSVNGSVPGPTIYANWGDNVKVHVHNGLTNNGTSIHFHGIRQNNTNPQDGVSSITQCPVAPGESIMYEWRASEYGTTWYHSHFSLQAWEGVFGGIIINGPASANYDVDVGMLFINDWSHQTVDEMFHAAETEGGQPTLDTGLINGTNVWTESDGTVVGSRLQVDVDAGKSYRLRLINAGISASFKFMIDNHLLTVIAADLVPIKPYNTTSLTFGPGQRYDVIVHANQENVASNHWMRAIAQTNCSKVTNYDDIKGILHYGDSRDVAETPSTSPFNYTDSCVDESMSNLVPILEVDASPATFEEDDIANVSVNANGIYQWFMGPTTFKSEWNDPTLLQISQGSTSWYDSEHVIQIDGVNEWVFVAITAATGAPHPVHLHGHDFVILAQGTGTYSNETTLQLKNPPRRDTAVLPGHGYLVIGFQTNNPGAWLMHCHIGWHSSEGFALQFVERYDEIKPMIDNNVLKSTCAAWNRYVALDNVVEEDSGI